MRIGRRFFYTPLPPHGYIGTVPFMSLPFYPLRAYPFYEMFIVYQYGVHLPSDSSSLQVGVLYSNAYRNSVVVREGDRHNFYSNFLRCISKVMQKQSSLVAPWGE